MAGHSKWKNIAHKKDKTDAGRAKIFTKISREIIVAVRAGGPDPDNNAKLKECIYKARQNNVPQDNIKRVIDRASGSAANENYEAVQYEGYGPSAVAVIVECMTDNRNRTAGEVRHYFDKFGAGLGANGCVSWNFTQKGVIIISRDDDEHTPPDEDELMLFALEAGAADFAAKDELFEIYTEPDDFPKVRNALEQKGYALLSAEVEMVPGTQVTLTEEDDVRKMRRLLDTLEDNDDVQHVWHNWENIDE